MMIFSHTLPFLLLKLVPYNKRQSKLFDDDDDDDDDVGK